MKIVFLGDIVGPKGIDVASKHLLKIKQDYSPDLIIANIENSAPKGRGISEDCVKKLTSAGCHVFTGGNHSFARKESYAIYQQNKNVIRPINFPNGVPGNGYYVYENLSGDKVVVINVQLRVYMRECLGCPFKAIESVIQLFKNENPIIFIDVHGEATSEKISFGIYFDGMVSAIVGTHTHVQTADERILPKGSAYITDVGMTGALNSSLGVKASATIYNFINQLPSTFELEEDGDFISNGVLIEVENKTKKAISIKRLSELYK